MMAIWLMLLFNEKAFGGTTPKVCLTWKISSDNLELRCKTENFRYSITFYDPVGNEQAFCTPNSCYPLMNWTYLSQNITTQETYLTIPLGADAEKFNGWWVCTYGNTNGKSKVEITLSTKFTIVGKKDNTTRKKSTPPYNSDNSCTKLIFLSFFAWLTVGFLATHQILSIITAAECLAQRRDDLKNWSRKQFQKRLCSCLTKRKKGICPVPVVNTGIALLLIIILVYINTRDEKCDEHLPSKLPMVILPICLGILLQAFIFCLLHINYDLCEYQHVATTAATQEGTPPQRVIPVQDTDANIPSTSEVMNPVFTNRQARATL